MFRYSSGRRPALALFRSTLTGRGDPDPVLQPPPMLRVLPLIVLLALYLPAALSGGWILDDARGLATHLHHGDPFGEWTHATYAWSAGDGGHIWRPLPAFVQHVTALAFGRISWVFRLLNLVVHGVLVVAAMRTTERWGASIGVATLVGLAIVVHPVVPDVIGWSSDVFDIGLALFLVLGLHGQAPGASVRGRVATAIVWTLAAVLSKESAAPLVLALPLAAWAAAGILPAVATGAAAATAVGAYMALHGVVTGQGYGGVSSPIAHRVLAGLDAVGSLPTLPARATVAHLFDPAEWGVAAIGAALLVAAGAASWAFPARRQWVAAVVGAGLLLVPAAVGVPFIGVQPSRYVYAPLVWLLVLGAGPVAARAPGRLGMVLVGGVLLLWTPRAALRIWDYADDETLFTAELASEPANPYAQAMVARQRCLRGDCGPAVLASWADAIDRLPAHARVPNRTEERWSLAQAAFLAGAPDIALRMVREMSVEGGVLPQMAPCLEADALDALGRHVEAEAAAVGCP